MLKIKSINFVKSVYDESMSHQVFSVANIEFSNADPINGALLYWRKNTSEDAFTKEDEYKFFYDVSQDKFYAAVKFPQYVQLSKSQKQELAFILLEQRGFIGSYSFQTNKNAANVFKIHQYFKQLTFPKQFKVAHFKNYFNLMNDAEIEPFIEQYPFYTKEFVKTYSKWTQLLCQAHPNQFIKYLDYAQMTQICYQNPYLTEQFIINYVNKIDWHTLQYNLPVLDRLSKYTREHLVERIKENGDTLQNEIEENIKLFIDNIDFYKEDRVFYLPKEQDDNGIFGPFDYFEYDLGRNVWPGSEHLIKSIPSFAAQLYTQNGERNLSNQEMDRQYEGYNTLQKQLFEASANLHWLNRYKEKVNWTHVCLYNPHLNERFIEKDEKYIDFEALSVNTQCTLTSSFIDKYFAKLITNKPSPVILKSLTADLYEKHAHQFTLSSNMIAQVAHLLTEDQLNVLDHLIH